MVNDNPKVSPSRSIRSYWYRVPIVIGVILGNLLPIAMQPVTVHASQPGLTAEQNVPALVAPRPNSSSGVDASAVKMPADNLISTPSRVVNAELKASTAQISPMNADPVSTTSFAAGTLIIPMDINYQNYGMWRAYGLIYRLLKNNIPIYWAITPGNLLGGIDFNATTKDLRTNASIGAYDYRDGPFLIDSSYAGQAIPIIQSWWGQYANQPSVHIATTSFQAAIEVTVRSAPRIAVEATNSGIAIAYLEAAGIPDLAGSATWSTIPSPNIVDETFIANGGFFQYGQCKSAQYDIFVTPHNGGYSYSLTDPTNLGTKAYAQLDRFVRLGGGWTATCHSILSNENALVDLSTHGNLTVTASFPITGGLMTRLGFPNISNGGGTYTYNSAYADLPVAQIAPPVATPGLPGGSVQNWDSSIVKYWAGTERLSWLQSGSIMYDNAIAGSYKNGQGMGKITYIGGHNWGSSTPYSTFSNAPYLRMWFNSLFFNGTAQTKMEMSVTPASIYQGITATLAITIFNPGGTPAKNISTVHVTLEPGVQYAGMLYGPAPLTQSLNISNQVILDWGSSVSTIASGANALVIQTLYKAPSIVSEQKVASLFARYGDSLGESFTADFCRSVAVVAPPPLPVPQFSKDPNPYPDEVSPGDTVTWTLNYTNAGAGPLFNAQIVDLLPTGLAFASASATPSINGQQLTWNLGTLGANSSGSITLVGTMLPFEGSMTFTNTAALSGSDGTNPYLLSRISVLDGVAPYLGIFKTENTSVFAAGDTLTYTLNVVYTDPMLLANALVSDTLPPGTTFVTATAAGAYNTPLNAVNWFVGSNINGTDGVTADAGQALCPATSVMTTTADTYISQNNATKNYGGGTGLDTFPKAGSKDYTLIRFNLPSALPSGSAIQSAYMVITVTTKQANLVDQIYEMKTPWVEGTGNNAACTNGADYNQADCTSPGANWSSGVFSTSDYYSSQIASVTPAVKKAYNINVKTAVNDWVNNGVANNGLVFVPIGSAGAAAIFASSETSTPPYVIVTYLAPTAGGCSGKTTIVASADTYVAKGNATTNYGSSTTLATDAGSNNTTNNYKVTLVQWDLGQIAPGAFITSAVMSMTATTGKTSQTDQVYQVKTPWTESTATYNTTNGSSPWASGGSFSSQDYINLQGYITPTSNNTVYTVGLTSLVNNWLNNGLANRGVTLVPTGANNNDVVYDSAQATTGLPTLTINWYKAPSGLAGTHTTIGAQPLLQMGNGLVTVTMVVRSQGVLTNVVPPAALSIDPTSGVTATLLNGPSTRPITLTANTNYTYTYIYNVTPGMTPGDIQFYGYLTSPALTLALATSNNVLVSPPLVYSVQVPSPVTAGSYLITNTATLYDDDSFSDGVDSNQVVAQYATPILSIGKRAASTGQSPNDLPGTYAPGELITYTILYTNTGYNVATNVRISDTVPQSTTFVSASNGGTLANGRVTWNLGNVPTSTVPYTVTMTVQVTTNVGYASFNVGNTASLTSTEIVTPVTSNRVTETVYSQVNVIGMKLATTSETSPTLIANSLVQPGDLITYTLIFTNIGTGIASGTYFTDALDANTVFVSGAVSSTIGGITLTWGPFTLVQGASITRQFTVQVLNPRDSGSNMQNDALVDSQGMTPTHQTNYVSYQVSSAPKSAVAKYMSPPSGTTFKPGDIITITLVVSNTGNANSPVVLEDPLPSYLQYISNTTVLNSNTAVDEPVPGVPPVNAMAVCSPGYCSAGGDSGPLVVGSPATVTFRVSVLHPIAQGTVFTNVATAQAPAEVAPATSNLVSGTIIFPVLSGVVTNTLTGAPIEGATVTLTDWLGHVITATTDVTGYYVITSTPSNPIATGSATVNSGLAGFFTPVGYNPAINIVAGANTRNAPLSPITLGGVVTDQKTGQPIPGAVVTVTDTAGHVYTTATNSSGVYTFTSTLTNPLVAGPATVTATDLGYGPSTATPTLNPGANNQNLALPPTVLTGVVYDLSTSLPVANATVVVTDSAGHAYTTTADASGVYTFTSTYTNPLAPGTANVAGSAAGYATSVEQPTLYAGLMNVQDLYLGPTGSISGTVFNDVNGNAVNNSETGIPGIVITLRTENLVATTTTDANGNYDFTGVAHGSFTITVGPVPAGFVATTPGVVNGTQTAGGSSSGNDFGFQLQADLGISKSDGQSAVAPGATVTYSIVVTNAGPASVTGASMHDAVPAQVTSAAWTCTAGANAACPAPSNGSGSINASVSLSAGARLTITVVATVSVTAVGVVQNVATINPSPGVTDPQPATNITTDTDSVNGTALTGVVTDIANGQPIPGAIVTVTDSAGHTYTTTTDPSGVYTFTNTVGTPLSPGAATLTATAPGFVTNMVNPNIVAGITNSQNVSLTPNTLTGVVTDTLTTLPIAGATVVFTDSQGNIFTAITDANGQYAITGTVANLLDTGVGTVVASQPGYTPANGYSPSVTINPGPNVKNAPLTPNTVGGTVTDVVTSLPIPGAVVTLTDGVGNVYTTTTGPTGLYTFTSTITNPIVPGPAIITGTAPGYSPTTVTPVLTPGPNTDNLALSPTILTGVVKDSGASLPIPGAIVTVTDSAGHVYTTTADGSGVYTFTSTITKPLSPGNAHVSGSAPGYGTDDEVKNLVAGVVNTRDLILALTAPTVLTGVVTDNVTHLPIPGAVVTVNDGSGHIYTTTTDASGLYTFTSAPGTPLSPGVAILTTTANGYVPSVLNPTIVANATTIQDVPLTPYTLTGIVTDTLTGLPLPGATVVFTDSQGHVFSAVTGPNGSYAFTSAVAMPLGAGAGTVVSSKPGYTPASGYNPAVTINPGANVKNAPLTPLAGLSGVVTDNVTDLPIPGAVVTLTDSAGHVYTTTTDAGGSYAFNSTLSTPISTGPATVTASVAGYVTNLTNPTIVPGPNTANVPLTPNTLTGVVTNTSNGLPLQGATVVFTDSQGHVFVAITGPDGAYAFTSTVASPIDTGSGTVVAGKPGYIRAGGYSPAVSIDPGANIKNAPLTPVAGLSGIVTDSLTGLPIPGAVVTLTDSGNNVYTTTTDAGGNYSFYNSLPTGPATVVATAEGYAANTATPTIVPGPNTANIPLTPNSLTGVVTDTNTGLPLQGATVVFTDAQGHVFLAVTGANGAYAFTSTVTSPLDTGPGTLVATKPGYIPAAGYSPATTINTGANVKNAPLTPLPGLSGVVTNTLTGLPIPGAVVTLIDSGGHVYTTTTDAGGSYAFDSTPTTPISTGLATVTASCPGFAPNTVQPNIVTGPNTANVPLTPNTLTGIITDTFSGLPILAASVTFVDAQGHLFMAVTGPDGVYAFMSTVATPLEAGVGTLIASKTGYSPAAGYSSSTTINPGPNVKNAPLTPAPVVLGTVRDSSSGLPIPGTVVTLTDSAGHTYTTTTDSNGNYAFTSSPTSPIVPGSATISGTHTGYTADVQPLTVVPGPNVKDLALIPNQLTGVVTDTHTSLPLAGATVVFTDSQGHVFTALTDGSGAYTFTGNITTPLAAGAGTLTASKSGYLTANGYIKSVYIQSGANVKNAGLTPGLSLSGVVTDQNTGQVIPGALVTVTDSAGNTYSTVTDNTGYYYFVSTVAMPLLAGQATITATANGFVPAITSPPPLVQGTNVVDIPLAPTTLTGAVTDNNSGAPLPGATVVFQDSQGHLFAATTDVSGTYTFTSSVGIPIAAGTGVLIPYREGYVPATFYNTSVQIVPGPNVKNAPMTVNGKPTGVDFQYFNVAVTLRNVKLTWTPAGNTCSAFGIYRSNVSGSTDQASAVKIYTQVADAFGAPGYSYTDMVPGSGVWHYWLTCVSGSGVESAAMEAGTPAVVNNVYTMFLPALKR